MTARRVGWLVMVAAVIAAGLYGFGVVGGADETRASAVFRSAKGLYVGDEVRVLGVKVGRVESIEPEGDHVRVTFSWSDNVAIPADAKAAIVAPSLVASRFLQLAPAYAEGPKLGEEDEIPTARTAVPAEFDDVKTELTRLTGALAPEPGSRSGPLTKFLKVARANLSGGNAQQLNQTLHNLSRAARALSSGRGDLFATLRNLESFIGNLVVNDEAVRAFTLDLRDVAGTLADDKQQLVLAVDTLGQAFADMNAFLRENRGEATKGLRDLAELSSTLAEQTQSVEQILHVAPNALANFYNIIDPRYGAFTGTLGLGNLQAGAPGFICGMFAGVLQVSPASTPDQIAQFQALCKTAVIPFATIFGIQNSMAPDGQLPIPGMSPPTSGTGQQNALLTTLSLLLGVAPGGGQ